MNGLVETEGNIEERGKTVKGTKWGIFAHSL
jgi:hypothetical protein